MSDEEHAESLVEYLTPGAPGEGYPVLDIEKISALEEKVGAALTIEEALDLLWEGTDGIIPRDRIGTAFVDVDGEGVVAQFCKANYETLCIDKGYREGLRGSSLGSVIDTRSIRIIHDLTKYLAGKPDSISTKLLVKEGITASLTVPLKVESRPVGFLFFSSRDGDVYELKHAAILQAITLRMAHVIEKIWLINRLKAANENYISMLGFVSHELKSPLASLIAKGQTYAEGYMGKVDSTAVSVVNRMMEIAGHLTGMVSNYIDFARLENGEMKFAPQDGVEFCLEVVDFASDSVMLRADQRGCTIKRFLPDEDITVSLDPDLMRIAMINLLDNAVKYGDRDTEIELKIFVKQDTFVIKVKNTGAGFTYEQSKKLFKRFSRLNQVGLEDRKGSGLGLYLTWWIIQQHNGRISAESLPGKWAEFTVELPLS
ncbi:MAG: GAF domain-containing sensor histidine kinase [Planctomycetes bacterium]|nr:GAF domain-containing sensor histidine kinase [Planctomycetota bacterium]